MTDSGKTGTFADGHLGSNLDWGQNISGWKVVTNFFSYKNEWTQKKSFPICLFVCLIAFVLKF
jgi:hypothetical protein